MVPEVLAAAEELAAEGLSIEVIDPRTLVPFDWETVAASVRKTSRLLIVHEAPLTMGPGAEIASRAADELFAELDAPVRRLAGPDVPIPQNMALEQFCFPQIPEIVAAARELIRW
jgi:pyruvate dehydrogenase E1 component beta subunit